MSTKLLIQVLTLEDAEKVKSVLGENSKIVKLVFTGCFGVSIPFNVWTNSENQICNFLWKGKIEKEIGLEPSELLYREYGFVKKNAEYFEEVQFFELFPNAGYWKFNDAFEYSFSKDRIRWKGEVVVYDLFRSLVNKKEPEFIDGMSKLFRRGFLETSLKVKERWRIEYGNILTF